METFHFLPAKNHDREWKMNRLMCDKQLINSPFSTRVKMRDILDILVDNETHECLSIDTIYFRRFLRHLRGGIDELWREHESHSF